MSSKVQLLPPIEIKAPEVLPRESMLSVVEGLAGALLFKPDEVPLGTAEEERVVEAVEAVELVRVVDESCRSPKEIFLALVKSTFVIEPLSSWIFKEAVGLSKSPVGLASECAQQNLVVGDIAAPTLSILFFLQNEKERPGT